MGDKGEKSWQRQKATTTASCRQSFMGYFIVLVCVVLASQH
jgi:hypothetical protein